MDQVLHYEWMAVEMKVKLQANGKTNEDEGEIYVVPTEPDSPR